ncbi:MAG: helix-turn-helix domain-containing protein [Ruminococcaceae bacterium]|nr:helix-turn-helix domain-containing protein [Oscillospiraceae bacterium]
MYYICFDYSQNIAFSSAGRFISHNRQAHPKRILNTIVLLLGYSGECKLAQDGREYMLKKGTFQVLFPDTPHYGTEPTSKDQSHFWCHFNLPEGFFIKETDNPAELEQNSLCVLPEFSQIDNCEKFFVLFSQMIDEAEKMHEGNKTGRIICDAYIKILLFSLAEHCKNNSNQSDKKSATRAKIREFLRLHACDGMTAREAAAALHYNPDYLTQILKADTGMTLSEYLNDIRLKEAKNLLLNSNRNVTEIAYKVGFSDEKYFMKLFKRKENVTPTQYRNAHCRIHLNR